MRRCRRTKEVVFWDPTTGWSWMCFDDSCPLQKICYLASADNIYSNVERGKKPFLLDYDLSNLRKWAPLHLDGKSTMTIMTVQDEILHFAPADNHYAREIQGEVSESIQNAIRGWRRNATSFRSDAGTKIAHTIEKLEQARMKNGTRAYSAESNTSGPASQFPLPESITKARNVFGFTLHAPFSSLDFSLPNLLDRVQATEIHGNRNPRVEYAVVVRAFAYPGGLISLWVFVCSLVPKS